MGNCSSNPQQQHQHQPQAGSDKDTPPVQDVEPQRTVIKKVPDVPDVAPQPDLVVLGIGVVLMNDEYRAVKKRYLELKANGKQHKDACNDEDVMEKVKEVVLEDMYEAEDLAEKEQEKMVLGMSINEALWSGPDSTEWERAGEDGPWDEY
eukprot:TRINITY_DN21629_c0_g1_i2.p2 TRINITY_DN21629_c0_g1~~TRINITY_DN21629_c0_g1_i2.p2  ORF type:complete len:150 (+),score=60.81 TRINITY_DN21629_c0_g1_i2:60-509(+)